MDEKRVALHTSQALQLHRQRNRPETAVGKRLVARFGKFVDFGMASKQLELVGCASE